MTLVGVLTARDEEVYRVVEAISKRVEKRHVLGLGVREENFVDQRRIEALRASGEEIELPKHPARVRIWSSASWRNCGEDQRKGQPRTAMRTV